MLNFGHVSVFLKTSGITSEQFRNNTAIKRGGVQFWPLAHQFPSAQNLKGKHPTQPLSCKVSERQLKRSYRSLKGKKSWGKEN